jgi:hypothetical protein
VRRVADTQASLWVLIATTAAVVVPIASCTSPRSSTAVSDAGRDARADHTLGPFFFDGPATIDGSSPGTVTLELTIDPSTAFCDHKTSCDEIEHITILTASGQPLGWAGSTCPPARCSEPCLPVSCPQACLQDDGSFTGQQMVWNGSYDEELSCAGVTCLRARFAPPGHYLAQMCATAGTFVPGDAAPSNATCTPAGSPQCVTIGFDLPSALPIVGQLPALPND